MKTINLKNIIIDEIIIKPNDHMVVMYKLLDENDVPVYVKQVIIKNEDYPQINKLDQFVANLLVNLKGVEGV